LGAPRLAWFTSKNARVINKKSTAISLNRVIFPFIKQSQKSTGSALCYCVFEGPFSKTQ
jgi:hypothetical protein